jgi:hypothetical protein
MAFNIYVDVLLIILLYKYYSIEIWDLYRKIYWIELQQFIEFSIKIVADQQTNILIIVYYLQNLCLMLLK